MSKFEIGDRVKVIGNNGHHFAEIGDIGTVVSRMGDSVEVEMEYEDHGFHTCGGACRAYRGQYINESNLELVTSKKLYDDKRVLKSGEARCCPMVMLNISKEDCKNIADFLEIYFFQNIRDDIDMDNIEYVRGLINAIDELKKAAKEGNANG